MASIPSVVAREDTLLGVCFALGEDFGFNPTYLRIVFALTLFWSPAAAFGSYAAAGALVAVVRWMVPDPVEVEAVKASVETGERATFPDEDLPLAA